ncbi:hypothetical protein G9A89_001156 [Geosiphon pyriformis]|nr:hypothetical protein G9A89_001156 [Geosiphon pyriformis]
METAREKGNKKFKEGDYLAAREQYTLALALSPQDPLLWSNRAASHLKAGFPELAIVDAKKAETLLLKRGAAKDTLFFKIKYRYSEAAAALGVYEHAAEKLDAVLKEKNIGNIITNLDIKLYKQKRKEYREKAAKQKIIAEQRIENQSSLQNLLYDPLTHLMSMGSFASTGCYPWDTRTRNRMSKKTIQRLQRDLDLLSEKKLLSIEKIEFTSSVKDNSVTMVPGNPQLGIFAATDILKDTTILEEDPFITAHNYFQDVCDFCLIPLLPEENYRCENNTACIEVWCGAKCFCAAKELYHRPLCGKIESQTDPIISYTQKCFSTRCLTRLGVLKIFAIARTRNICPLDISEIGHLTRLTAPQNVMNGKWPWLQNFVPHYDHTLKILDINPYDLRYDFWIYLTCFSIFDANSFGHMHPVLKRPHSSWLNQIISLINHSCEPNTQDEEIFSDREDFIDQNKRGTRAHSCRQRLKAARDIKKGEQIFISYCETGANKIVRFKNLMQQFGFECSCSLCERESPKTWILSRGLTSTYEHVQYTE